LQTSGRFLGESNDLKNRYCHIKYNAKSTNKVTPKVTVNVTVKLSVNQKKILEEIKKNPFATQEELAKIVGITRKSINENMKKLQIQKIIERIGADKNGHWKIKLYCLHPLS
jgi:predicted HTH transcriptional regulator